MLLYVLIGQLFLVIFHHFMSSMSYGSGGWRRRRLVEMEGDGGIVSDVITYQNSVRRGENVILKGSFRKVRHAIFTTLYHQRPSRPI